MEFRTCTRYFYVTGVLLFIFSFLSPFTYSLSLCIYIKHMLYIV